MTNERWPQLVDAMTSGLLVQVRSEVPGFVVRRTHEQESAGAAGRRAHGAREPSCSLDPAGAGQKLAQHGDPGGVHAVMVPHVPRREDVAMSGDPNVTPRHVAILGGTGRLGRGLATRWARRGIAVVLGSREVDRAESVASRLGAGMRGAGNVAAASAADVVVLAVPWKAHEPLLRTVSSALAGRVVVDCVCPLGFDARGPYAIPVAEGSAAQQAQAIAPQARMVAAFHHVSSSLLLDPSKSRIDGDVLVVGDDAEAAAQAAALASVIPGMRGVIAGDLRDARALEALTASLLSINRRYTAHAGLRVTGLPEPA